METEKQEPVDTLKKLEIGDLRLPNKIQKGVLFFGNTKVGKTSTCHLLSSHNLIGKSSELGLVYYELDNNSNSEESKRACIGNN